MASVATGYISIHAATRGTLSTTDEQTPIIELIIYGSCIFESNISARFV